MQQAADLQNRRELTVSHDWFGELVHVEVVEGEGNQGGDLVFGRTLVPLL